LGYYGISGPNLLPGGIVAVKLDPKNPQRVAIDTDAEPDPILLKKAASGQTGALGTSGMPGVYTSDGGITIDMSGLGGRHTVMPENSSLKEKLQQLKEAYDAGLITPQEYEERRQRVLDEL